MTEPRHRDEWEPTPSRVRKATPKGRMVWPGDPTGVGERSTSTKAVQEPGNDLPFLRRIGERATVEQLEASGTAHPGVGRSERQDVVALSEVDRKRDQETNGRLRIAS